MATAEPQIAVNAPELPSMRADRDRFVALAFCWADVLFEVNEAGQIVFAGGATLPLIGRDASALVGRPLAEAVDPRDRALIGEQMKLARRGGRIENVQVRLQGERGPTLPLAVAGYRLDDLKGHYFLAFRMAEPATDRISKGDLVRDPESGLNTCDSFTRSVAQRLKAAGPDGRLTLLELSGFDDLDARLDPQSRTQYVQTIGACLRASALDGESAVRIADNRYGFIHGVDLDIDDLRDKITVYGRNADPTGEGVKVESATLDVQHGNISEEDLANGLVYAINQFRTATEGRFTIGNLSANLGGLVNEAMTSVNDFKRMVKAAEFDIAFQPIVHAKSGTIHHYEALARFPAAENVKSPFEVITFAEETGLIAEFDLAMAKKAMDWMSKPANKASSVAVNVSGHSIESLTYVAGIHTLLRQHAWSRGRLVFEITESSRIRDLASAGHFIEGLRQGGYQVCLDDFGAGAANFQYLSALEVDTVKLDGSAIVNARRARKGKAFLKALTSLCRELGVKTVAEMIDDRAGLDFVRECRVDFVQGYLFGKPGPDVREFNKSFPKHLFSS